MEWHRSIVLLFLGIFVSVANGVALTPLASFQFFRPSRTFSRNKQQKQQQSSLRAITPNCIIDRETILARNGNHFDLDRFNGKIEFGSTVNLVTTLENGDLDTISLWLSDERRVAISIWDEKLLTDLGDSVYRLQLMTLHFVTIQLAPSVDVRMWIEWETDNVVRTVPSRKTRKRPVFKLQSFAFDPNVQILPGIGLNSESLGISIQVVGELRPSPDGRGVTGWIGFVSSGDLPLPMRLLPDRVLQASTDLINRTVARFAVRSFEKGITAKYLEHYQFLHAAKNGNSSNMT